MKESSLTINVYVDPGTDISAAFIQAVALASKCDVCVSFTFNGVTCIAFPNGSPSAGVMEFGESLKSDRPHKFAIAG
jgi:hypothetical protein